MIDALDERVRSAAVRSSASASACSSWPSAGSNTGSPKGLGWIAGEVDKIAPADPELKIPHMGWNTLNALTPHPLLDGFRSAPTACMPISCIPTT